MVTTWMTRLREARPGETTTWFYQEVERRFNVRIVPNGIHSGDGESAQLMMAAGDFPDCGVPPGSVLQHYRDGLIRGIPLDMIREYAPAYVNGLNDAPMGWLLDRNPDDPEECLAVQSIYGNVTQIIEAVSSRASWAEKVGMLPSDYDEVKIPLDRFVAATTMTGR